jgi:hypothetical protein
MSKYTSFFYFAILILFFSSCEENGRIAEKSNIVPISINRFDLDFLTFDFSQPSRSAAAILHKHPDIFPFYVRELMGLGDMDSASPHYYLKYMAPFLKGEYTALHDSCTIIFKDMKEVERDLTSAFSHYKYHFPERKTPIIYSMLISPNGKFPAAFEYGKDTLGFNMFCYLGENFSFYPSIYDMYWIKWLKKEYIPRNLMLVQYNAYNKQNNGTAELLYEMIEAGKKMYYLDCMIPESSDAVKIGYSEEQLKWCKENEKDIWGYFTDNKLFHSHDIMDYKKYIEEGPSTAGMPKESPGMVGVFIGWQIVKKYMNANPTVKLNTLLYQTNAKTILSTANYKP